MNRRELLSTLGLGLTTPALSGTTAATDPKPDPPSKRPVTVADLLPDANSVPDEYELLRERRRGYRMAGREASDVDPVRYRTETRRFGLKVGLDAPLATLEMRLLVPQVDRTDTPVLANDLYEAQMRERFDGAASSENYCNGWFDTRFRERSIDGARCSSLWNRGPETLLSGGDFSGASDQPYQEQACHLLQTDWGAIETLAVRWDEPETGRQLRLASRALEHAHYWNGLGDGLPVSDSNDGTF